MTPIRVRIENDGDRALRIRYQELALVWSSGERYSALPPVRIESESQILRPVAGYSPIAAPAFHHTGFHLAPHLSTIYPSLTVGHHGFLGDPFYYGHYSSYWDGRAGPSAPMVENGLPEGVLDPGGALSGFLYYERVPADAHEVTLRAELVAAGSGQRFGEVSIPFVVEGSSS